MKWSVTIFFGVLTASLLLACNPSPNSTSERELISAPSMLPRPLNGMAYDPKPSNWNEEGAPDHPKGMYFDDDFYNDDFKQLWGTQGESARNDIGNMKTLGVKFLRMYNWNYQRNHQLFLEYSADNNLRVSLPFCNGCMSATVVSTIFNGDNNYLGVNKYSTKAQNAIGLFIVGTELNGYYDYVGQATDAVARATTTLPLSSVPICTPIKTNGSNADEVVANALVDIKAVYDKYSSDAKKRFIACVNFYGVGMKGQIKAPKEQLNAFVTGIFADNALDNKLGASGMRLLISELGVFRSNGGTNIEPNANGDANLQAAWLKELLVESNTLVGKFPYFLGSVMFQYTNQNHVSGMIALDRDLGVYALKEPSSRKGKARNTDPAYPIDDLIPTTLFDSVKAAHQ